MDSKKKSFATNLSRRHFLRTTALGTAAVLSGCSSVQLNGPLVQINHLPKKYSRRYGSFTANVCGILSKHAKNVKYKLNNGEWKPVRQKAPRVSPPNFTLEMKAEDLIAGKNHLEISASAAGHDEEITRREFDYDPGPIRLPVTRDWSQGDLDVQDGYWEVVERNGMHRVRLKKGYEDYDRIVVVAGAFPQGRRVETDLIFRKNAGNPFGFGILPLWGGRPDDEGVTPSRGWDFSCAWFYSYYNAVGMEFSYKNGAAKEAFVSTYKSYPIKPDARYFIVVESWPEFDESGKRKLWRQRMKWRKESENEKSEWIELTDIEGAPLPSEEYAVALVCHRSSVEFGPVKVTAIDGPDDA